MFLVAQGTRSLTKDLRKGNYRTLILLNLSTSLIRPFTILVNIPGDANSAKYVLLINSVGAKAGTNYPMKTRTSKVPKKMDRIPLEPLEAIKYTLEVKVYPCIP